MPLAAGMRASWKVDKKYQGDERILFALSSSL